MIWAEVNDKEMEKTTVKINKTKGCFFEKKTQNWQAFSQIHQGKKRRIESTKLEMKKERLQQTMQKYKGL